MQNSGSSTSLAETLAEHIKRQINEGNLQAGEKLASLRDYARLHGCAKNTVVSAYERLVAEGVIEPRRGSGYFVKGSIGPRTLDGAVPALSHTLVKLGLQSADAPLPRLAISEGLPPSEWLESCRLDRYIQKIGRSGLGTAFRYGDPMGYPSLRGHISRRLNEQGIPADASRIIFTQGSYQAIDIIIRHFVQRGDDVLVDVPGFYPTMEKLELQGARVIGIPRLPSGPDVSALRSAMEKSSARIFFTQSVAHNPTGSDISPQTCEAISALAREKGLLVVDDDALGDFTPMRTPKLAAFDQLQHTLHVGTFSKSLSGIVRVGYIACSREYVDPLINLKTILSLNSSQYAERTVDAVITEGRFNRHVLQLQDRSRRAMEHAISLMQKLDAQLFCEPDHGLYLWASLPGITDANAFAHRLRREKQLVMAPGSIFYPDKTSVVPWFRFNVGFMENAQFFSVFAEALQ